MKDISQNPSFRKNNKINLYLSASLAIVLIIKALLYFLNKCFSIYLLMGNINQVIVGYFLNMLIAIILTVTLFLHIRKPIIKIVTAISIAIILLCCSFIFLLAYDDPKYFTFKSQGNETILIAEEHAWLLAGWSRLYVRHDFMFVRDLKIRIGTDDGYRPFSNEDYKLTWIDKNTVSLSYGFGYSNIVKTEIIKVR